MRAACGGGAGGEFCAAVSFPGGRISGERGTDRANRADGGKGRESAVSGKRVGSSVIRVCPAGFFPLLLLAEKSEQNDRDIERL